VNEKKEFYVYIYLDPRKKGIYKYGDYEFEAEPFYVGKGKRYQHMTHLQEVTNNRPIEKVGNKHKFYKIKLILEAGLEPIILKIKIGLTERKAFDLEIWMIWAIGRLIFKEGPLTNIHEGGSGGGNEHRIGKTCEQIYGDEKAKQMRIKLSDNNAFKGKYELTYPDGTTIITVKNLAKFCRDNSDLNISSCGLQEVSSRRQHHHKGFKCKKISGGLNKDIVKKMRNTVSKISENQKEKTSKKLIKNNNATGEWEIIHPNGFIKIIKNLSKFCRDNSEFNLNPECMRLNIQHKGFKCRKISGGNKYIHTIETRQILSEKGKCRVAWNKGLTKETDLRIKQQSKTLKESMKKEIKNDRT
jgi:hypothetical protein